MNVISKILFITKIAFIPVWWCLTYSLLSLYYSTYEAVLDPINKVREVMRVIFQPYKSRQLTNVSIPCLIHNNTVWSSCTTQLIFCLQRCPVAYYQFSVLCQEVRAIMFLFHIKCLAILLPNYCPAQLCGMGCEHLYFIDTWQWWQ